MTEPEDDITELSSRRRGTEDATRLAGRRAATGADPSKADDATLLSKRKAPDVAAPEDATSLSERKRVPVDEDGTRLSPRLPVPEADAAVAEDETRVSRRPSGMGHSPRTGRATLPPLPPGVLGGAAAERGAFGQPPAEYDARDAPAPAAQWSAPPRATPIPAASAPDAERVRARREAARHRKLVTSVVVVAATAALMTAAIIAIVTLLNGA